MIRTNSSKNGQKNPDTLREKSQCLVNTWGGLNLTITREMNIKATEPPDQQKLSLVVPNIAEDAEQQELAGGRVKQSEPGNTLWQHPLKQNRRSQTCRQQLIPLPVLVLGTNPMMKAAWFVMVVK